MQALFKQLDNFLIEHQSLWRFEPFFQSAEECSPWTISHPQLEDWLSALSIADIDQFKQNPELLIELCSRYIPELKVITDLVQLPTNDSHEISRNLSLETGIPGRKLTQIKSLGRCVLQQHQGNEWLEWCSGKGYLGRFLAFESKQPVVSFEFQQSLCEAGQREAEQLSLPMTFVQGDAFEPTSRSFFHSDQHAVALHACGDLHVEFIRHAADEQTKAVSFSPCCYHLIKSDNYQALSRLGQNSRLQLTRSELRIPLQETVTGGERVKRHRQLEMSFRLGLDELLTHELRFTDYCPVPSIKKSLLSDGFKAFCLWAAAQKKFVLPPVNFEHYERLGNQRFWQMERLSLVQQVFRRLLELWLVLDKSLFLQERGYEVQLSEFCSREITPRNILVHAVRSTDK